MPFSVIGSEQGAKAQRGAILQHPFGLREACAEPFWGWSLGWAGVNVQLRKFVSQLRMAIMGFNWSRSAIEQPRLRRFCNTLQPGQRELGAMYLSDFLTNTQYGQPRHKRRARSGIKGCFLCVRAWRCAIQLRLPGKPSKTEPRNH